MHGIRWAEHHLATPCGLEAVEAREITVSRTFADFDDFWTATRTTPGVVSIITDMSSGDIERLQAGLRQRLSSDADGRIAYTARANAVKGHLPSGCAMPAGPFDRAGTVLSHHVLPVGHSKSAH